MIYFAYFHSVMEFGILFWGVSVESKKVFLQQKKGNQNHDKFPPPPPRPHVERYFANWKF